MKCNKVDKRNVNFSILDVNRIWLPDNEQPVMDLKWQQMTNCNPTSDTEPCRGSKESIVNVFMRHSPRGFSGLIREIKLHVVREPSGW